MLKRIILVSMIFGVMVFRQVSAQPQDSAYFVSFKANVFGTSDDFGGFSQAYLAADLSNLSYFKSREKEFGFKNFVCRWRYFNGSFNGARYWDHNAFIYDGSGGTSLRIKAFSGWPLIIDLDLGAAYFNFIPENRDFDRLPSEGGVIAVPSLWYVWNNSSSATERNSQVWSQIISTAGFDYRKTKNGRPSSEFNTGIRYDLRSSDLDLTADEQTLDPWISIGAGYRYLNSMKNNYGNESLLNCFILVGDKMVSCLKKCGIQFQLPGVGVKLEFEGIGGRDLKLNNWAILFYEPLDFLN